MTVYDASPVYTLNKRKQEVLVQLRKAADVFLMSLS